MAPKNLEFAILSSIAALLMCDIILVAVGNVQVDWKAYLPGTGFALFLYGLGQFYRNIRKDELLASTLIGAGSFIAFTLVASVFNYLLLPVKFPLIDQQLLAMDAWFHYSWNSTVELAAQYPAISSLLRLIYFSSLPQLIVVVLVLGFSGRLQSLWEFLAVGCFGVLACILIWFFFPSLGPTTLIEITPEVIQKASLGVTPAYGAELRQLAEFGETFISPTKVLGLIAFPSFHMVMALMAVTYLLQVPYLRWLALIVNLLMVPAILVHGGHYAVDLPAGALIFFVTRYLLRIKFHNKQSVTH